MYSVAACLNDVASFSVMVILGSMGSTIVLIVNGAGSVCRVVTKYSTTRRNGNPVNGNHLDESLSFPVENRNSLTWVLVALTVCFTYPESRPNLELASGNCGS